MDQERRKESWFGEVKEASFDFLNPQSSGLTPNIGGGGDQVIQIGSGDTSINADLTGFWIGNRRFSRAPFRVDMQGRMIPLVVTADGHTIMDELGILGEFNFETAELEKNDDQTITGTTWQGVLGLNHGLERLRPGRALFFVNIAGYHDDVDGRLEFRLLVNSVQVGGVFCLNQVADATTPQTAFQMIVAPLTEGHNALVVEARSSNANDGIVNGTVIPSFSSYLLLGR